MNNGTKLRLKCHKILFKIYNSRTTIDKIFSNDEKEGLSSRDIAFIHNVCLNTMRYYYHAKKILSNYINKKTKLDAQILLFSAVTQIVFLNFKEYAVVNSSVEVGKILKIHTGFINASLRKIISQKNLLKKIKVNFEDLPVWFKEQTINFNDLEKENFIKSFCEEPSLHLVFKNQNYKSIFKEKIYSTSDHSGFLINKKKIENIHQYQDGSWWVQDFSSSLPLININEKILGENSFDMCAAPGGKSFQILSKKRNLTLNDISKKRIITLEKNLKRLNFKAKITNLDFEKIEESKKYDFIVVDAPCSSIGTIRKNPELLFRKVGPNIVNLIRTQKLMLNKASKMLNKNGAILYMVCSFLKIETLDQIDIFLKKNKNFVVGKLFTTNNNHFSKGFIKNDILSILPSKINEYKVDGYFAVLLKNC